MITKRDFFRQFGGLIASVAIAQKCVVDIAEKLSESSNLALCLHRYETICFQSFVPYFQDFMQEHMSEYDKKVMNVGPPPKGPYNFIENNPLGKVKSCLSQTIFK